MSDTTSSTLMTITASGSSIPTPITYRGENLPAGLSVDATTGTLSGTPTSTQRGSFSLIATGSDKIDRVLQVPFAITIPIDPATDPITISIKAYMAEYETTLNKAVLTTTDQAKAGTIFLALLNYLASHPRLTYIDELTAWMVTNRSTYFSEMNFFSTLSKLIQADRNFVSDVYTAFRGFTASSKRLVYNTTALGQYPKASGFIEYITALQTGHFVTGAKPANTGTGTTPTYTTGKYTLPQSTTDDGALLALGVGGPSYQVTTTGASTVSFTRDGTLNFPSVTPYFSESLVHFTRTSGTLTLDSTVILSNNAQHQLTEITGGTYVAGQPTVVLTSTMTESNLLLMVGSYNSGQTWIVQDIDAF